MEIKEFNMVVTMYHPLTHDVLEEHYFDNVNEAITCFNELCDARPLAVIEFGVMTLCSNPSDDSYRVIKTRW